MFPVDEIRFGIALSQIAGTRGVGIGVKEGCIQGDRLIESHVLIPRRGAEDGIHVLRRDIIHHRVTWSFIERA